MPALNSNSVCQAIYQVLQHEYLKCPSTSEEWLKIAKVFEDRWNLPNCIGAGDGKHIRIRCPPNTGSDFKLLQLQVIFQQRSFGICWSTVPVLASKS